MHIHGPEGAAQEEAPAGPGHTCLGRAEAALVAETLRRPYSSYCKEICYRNREGEGHSELGVSPSSVRILTLVFSY